MDVLTPAITGGLLAIFTVVLAWMGKERFARIETVQDQFRTEMTQFRTEMTQMMVQLSSEMLAMRSEVGAELAAVRSDLTLIALAVGAQTRPQTG